VSTSTLTTVIDHVVIATCDVNATAAMITEQCGVPTEIGGHHVGLGTWNRLVSFGDGRYLEIIGPDPDQPAPDRARPFGLDAITDVDHARVATVCLRPSDITAAIDAAAALGVSYDGPTDTSRQSPAGLLRWKLSFPTDDEGGSIAFLIDWEDTPHPSRTVTGGLELASLDLTHPEPDRIAALYTAMGCNLAVTAGPAGWSATLRGPAGERVIDGR